MAFFLVHRPQDLGPILGAHSSTIALGFRVKGLGLRMQSLGGLASGTPAKVLRFDALMLALINAFTPQVGSTLNLINKQHVQSQPVETVYLDPCTLPVFGGS